MALSYEWEYLFLGISGGRCCRKCDNSYLWHNQLMMEIVRGVCIFCTANDTVLADNDKTTFLKLIKDNFFTNNRFSFVEFSTLFNKLSLCILCAHKIQCFSNVRDAFKKGDTIKYKRNQDICCSLCFKTHNVMKGTPQLKKEAAQFVKDIDKKGRSSIIKYICLSCTFSVSNWGNTVTAIWNLLNDESADSEKENVARTDASVKIKIEKSLESESKSETSTGSRRLRARPSSESENKSSSESFDSKSNDSSKKLTGKRGKLAMHQTNGVATSEEIQGKMGAVGKRRSTGSQNGVTPKKQRMSTRLNSNSDEKLKSTRGKHENSSGTSDEPSTDSAPVQTKKRRISGEAFTPKNSRIYNLRATLKNSSAKKPQQKSKQHSNGMLDQKLKHLNTVNNRTQNTNMHLSYSAVMDQRIMFEIPYIACTSTDLESYLTKKSELFLPYKDLEGEEVSSQENSVISEKQTGKGTRMKNKRNVGKTSASIEGMQKEGYRKTRIARNVKKIVQEEVISVSSTEDETADETEKFSDRRRSGRKRKPTSKASLFESNKKHDETSYTSSEKSTSTKKTSASKKTQPKNQKSNNGENEVSNENAQAEDGDCSKKLTRRNTKRTGKSDKQGKGVSSEDSSKGNENSEDSGEENAVRTSTEDPSVENEMSEEVDNNEDPSKEASVTDESVENSQQKMDTDVNVEEEIEKTLEKVTSIEEEASNVDKDSVASDEHKVVDEETGDKDHNARSADVDTEEPDKDKIADNEDASNNKELDNKSIEDDASSNDKSETSTVNEEIDDKSAKSDENSNESAEAINEDTGEQNAVTNSVDEMNKIASEANSDACKGTIIEESIAEETVDNVEITEETVPLTKSDSVRLEANQCTDKVTDKQSEENEDDSKGVEESSKIEEITAALENPSTSGNQLSDSSSQVADITDKNLSDESSRNTGSVYEGAVVDIDTETMRSVDVGKVANDGHAGLLEIDEAEEMESLEVYSQNSSDTSPAGQLETADVVLTDGSDTKGNAVIAMETDVAAKVADAEFATVETVLEHMGA